MNSNLSVVMPVHNEAAGIERVVSAFYDEIIRKTGAEFIIAEDGSTDGTKEVLQNISTKLPIRLYLGRRRKGYALAAKDALRQASSAYVLFSDSDGQYIPSDFWSIWSKKDDADVVIGTKVNRAEGVHRLILSRGFHFFVRVLFGVRLRDIDSGFRLVKRTMLLSVLDNVEKLEYSFWGEFTIRAHSSNAKIVEVPVRHYARAEGGTRIYGIRKLPFIVSKQFLGLVRLRLELSAMKKR